MTSLFESLPTMVMIQICSLLHGSEIGGMMSLSKTCCRVLEENKILLKTAWILSLDSTKAAYFWTTAIRHNIKEDNEWMQLILKENVSSRLTQFQVKSLLLYALKAYHKPTVKHLMEICNICVTAPNSEPSSTHTRLQDHIQKLGGSTILKHITCQFSLFGASSSTSHRVVMHYADRPFNSIHREVIQSPNSFCFWQSHMTATPEEEVTQGVIFWLGAPEESKHTVGLSHCSELAPGMMALDVKFTRQ